MDHSGLLSRRQAVIAALGAALVPVAAQAQSSSSGPIKFIVGQPPGSGSDTIVRRLADQLTTILGQPIIVENKPGAGGNIATHTVAKSPGDGQTLLFSTSNNLTGNFFLYSRLGFRFEDFAPIAPIAQTGFALAVQPSGPKDVAEFRALIRDKQTKAKYGAPTSSSLAAAELCLSLMGATATRVPYKSGPQALSDLIGGEIDFMFIDALTGIGQAKQGRIKLLGVTTKERLALAPDLPSLDDAGLKGYDLGAWFGVFAPAATPKDAQARLSKAITEAVGKKEMRDFLTGTGNEPLTGGPDQLMTLVKAHTDLFRDLSTTGKIKPED